MFSHVKRVVAQHFLPYCICDQRRLRSTGVSMQSDQSLRVQVLECLNRNPGLLSTSPTTGVVEERTTSTFEQARRENTESSCRSWCYWIMCFIS